MDAQRETALAQPELSIVIPVYNGGRFFRETIDSLLGQTLDRNRFEIVIVNDGSTDDTPQFCDALASELPGFVRVLHKENSGSPAGPRNSGARMARGEYIFFVDADDIVPPTSLESMLRHAREKQLDIGIFKIDASSWDSSYGGLFERPQDNCTVFNSRIMNSLGPCKLFRRDLIVENDINFPEGILYEDLPFALECYLHAKRISVITDMVYYVYRAREDGSSISQSIGAARLDEQVEGVAHYLKVAARYASPQECPHIYTRAFRYLDYALPHIIDQERLDLLARSAEIAQEHYCDQVRSLMPFANMSRIDALVAQEHELLGSMLKQQPLLSFSNSEENAGDVFYEMRALDGAGEYPEKREFVKALPRDFGWGRPSLEAPKIVHNLLTHASLNHTEVSFGGRMQILRACEGPAVSARLRTNQGLLADTELKMLSCRKVYADVWHMVFEWRAAMPLAVIEPTITGKQMVHFHLDTDLPNGETIANRIGRYRKPQVPGEFTQSAVSVGLWTLTPEETKYHNFSLRVTPTETPQPPKPQPKKSLRRKLARKVSNLVESLLRPSGSSE